MRKLATTPFVVCFLSSITPNSNCVRLWLSEYPRTIYRTHMSPSHIPVCRLTFSITHEIYAPMYIVWKLELFSIWISLFSVLYFALYINPWFICFRQNLFLTDLAFLRSLKIQRWTEYWTSNIERNTFEQRLKFEHLNSEPHPNLVSTISIEHMNIWTWQLYLLIYTFQL